jgi:hypothetical protein
MEDLFFGYPPLPSALRQLTNLKESQVEILYQGVEETGFSRLLNRCKSISKKLDGELKPKEVFQIFGAIRFLYDRCRAWEAQRGEYKEQLKEFLELSGLSGELGEDFEGPGFQRIVKLVAKNRIVEKNRKINWLKTGILDTAVEFSSRVELRPRFSEDRKQVEDLIPGIVLQILIERSGGDEKTQVFQLTKEGLSKLRKSIEDIEKKIEVLSSDPFIGQKFLGSPQNQD